MTDEPIAALEAIEPERAKGREAGLDEDGALGSTALRADSGNRNGRASARASIGA